MREDNDYAVRQYDTALMCDEMLASLFIMYAEWSIVTDE